MADNYETLRGKMIALEGEMRALRLHLATELNSLRDRLDDLKSYLATTKGAHHWQEGPMVNVFPDEITGAPV